MLDSRRGEIVVLGGDDKGADQAAIDNRGPLRALTVATRAFNLTEPDKRHASRFAARAGLCRSAAA